ncbi:hypothetical protein [Bacillus kexueae]|uniref:hypothetical protein n=1 Tax=Aeribacillus kexueae TaxID=2078952 RepID=UPI001FAF95CC
MLSFILYFPEDKSEYVGAFLQMIPFLLLSIGALWFFIRLSKKEQRKADELAEKLLNKESEKRE